MIQTRHPSFPRTPSGYFLLFEGLLPRSLCRERKPTMPFLPLGCEASPFVVPRDRSSPMESTVGDFCSFPAARLMLCDRPTDVLMCRGAFGAGDRAGEGVSFGGTRGGRASGEVGRSRGRLDDLAASPTSATLSVDIGGDPVPLLAAGAGVCERDGEPSSVTSFSSSRTRECPRVLFVDCVSTDTLQTLSICLLVGCQ